MSIFTHFSKCAHPGNLFCWGCWPQIYWLDIPTLLSLWLMEDAWMLKTSPGAGGQSWSCSVGIGGWSVGEGNSVFRRLRISSWESIVIDCSAKKKPSRKFRKLYENSVWDQCLVLDGCKWPACRGQCSFLIPSFPLCARSGWGWFMRRSRGRFEEPI